MNMLHSKTRPAQERLTPLGFGGSSEPLSATASIMKATTYGSVADVC
jgi:hypothetical protein